MSSFGRPVAAPAIRAPKYRHASTAASAACVVRERHRNVRPRYQHMEKSGHGCKTHERRRYPLTEDRSSRNTVPRFHEGRSRHGVVPDVEEPTQWSSNVRPATSGHSAQAGRRDRSLRPRRELSARQAPSTRRPSTVLARGRTGRLRSVRSRGSNDSRAAELKRRSRAHHPPASPCKDPRYRFHDLVGVGGSRGYRLRKLPV